MPIAPVKTFILSAPADEAYKTQLLQHLQPLIANKLLAIWPDGATFPSEGWENAFKKGLESSELVLVLVSVELLNSGYLQSAALRATLEPLEAGQTHVVPVVVSPCAWKFDPIFKKWPVLPLADSEGVRPVSDWTNVHSAWAKVVEQIGDIVEAISQPCGSAVKTDDANPAPHKQTLTPTAPLTVAIVDDDTDIREDLRWILDNTEGFSCFGLYKNCGEAVSQLAAAPVLPDVVLMDIGMPGQSGVECVRILKQQHPSLCIVMQTVHSADNMIFDSLRAGASGYVLKKTPVDRLLQALREAREGGAPMSGEVARKVLDFFQQPKTNPKVDGLSERELDVLRLLIEGHSYKIIAGQLYLSVHTVRFHLHNIYEKLHVGSRMEAVAKAMKHKWF